MTEALVLAIDVGTTVAKAVLFDRHGQIHRLARAQTPLQPEGAGRSEIDMVALWHLVGELARDAVGDRGPEVAAVALSGTSCGAFLIDAEGRPVGSAILWNDGRAADQIAAWQADGTLDAVFRISGNVMFPGYTAAVIRHLSDHDPARLARARTVFCCKDWIRFCMTGRRATDISDASYMPFDLKAGRFSRAIWQACGIDGTFGLLPDILQPDDIAGVLTSETAAELGLTAGIPVIAGLTDVASASLGAGAVNVGDACTILGTSCLNSLVTDQPPLGGPAVGITARTVGNRCIRSMVNTAGTMNIDWYLREIAGDTSGFDALESAVAHSPIGARGVLYLPYLNNTGVLSPFVHPHARAQFFGLSIEHSRADLARAVLEGVAYAIRDCYAAMPEAPTGVRLVGGGGRSPVWCQMIADCLGVPAHVTDVEEPGAWGVAMLAFKALGSAETLADLATKVATRATYTPDPDRHRRYGAFFDLYRRVAAASLESWTERARLLSTMPDDGEPL